MGVSVCGSEGRVPHSQSCFYLMGSEGMELDGTCLFPRSRLTTTKNQNFYTTVLALLGLGGGVRGGEGWLPWPFGVLGSGGTQLVG